MVTRCKFQCQQVLESKDHKGVKTAEHIKLFAATMGYRGEDDPAMPENASFWKWTPSGGLEFEVTNENVFGSFVPGLDYYLDLALVPKELQSNPNVAEESGAFKE